MRNEVMPFGKVIDQLFNQNLSDVFGVDVLHSRPQANILEESDRHILELAIPGMDKENINLQVIDNRLVIEAVKKEESNDEQSNEKLTYTRREFDFSSFKRSFHIPETADVNKIKAEFDAGVLRVTIDKKEEAVEKGPINIKVS